MIDYPSFDQGMNYPDLSLPGTGYNSPFMDEPAAQGEVTPDFMQQWQEQDSQEIDDWEYFFYGIPAGNESFIGLGD